MIRPSGILKSKPSSPGVPAAHAGHVSLNVDTTSLRNSEKQGLKSRLFSPILSLRNNFTGELTEPAGSTPHFHSRIRMGGFDGLKAKKMNETYNSMDLKEKLTKYR